ncbi:ABC transporter ATP-binding protein [Nitriliruptor alkaliphilus]|uniref:ABC transporter ATP-binding protein n=1 Tax=Nitriliruptor alkaliphilus TaxID=427918 RepID=UPI000696EF07|nr:ABC transporter ATP-binding protein [Nitriliruptor alkaliphilus]
MSTDLYVDTLTVRYDPGEAAVLDQLTLHVPRGEFLAVLGRSGCGKSTLLNTVAGFTSPESGVVRVDDQVVTGPGRDRGVVFQHDVLYPWMSISRNVAFGLKAMGVGRDRRLLRARELLTLVGLDPDEVATKLPHQLSGGMRQRVGIARMLATEPRVMLMDEPFGALDAMTRLAMQDLVLNLWRELHATILFITHDVDEALRISSRIAVLGPGGELLEHLENPLPHPRPAGGLAELPGYASLRRHLHDLLGLGSPVPTS